jgi:hypothetical protein
MRNPLKRLDLSQYPWIEVNKTQAELDRETYEKNFWVGFTTRIIALQVNAQREAENASRNTP